MHQLLAQLNRRLDRRGEWVYLRRNAGTGTNTSFVECRIPAIVNTLTREELIAGISQQNFIAIVSPTHIARQQWPGGRPVVATPNTLPPGADPAMPVPGDKLVIRGTSRNIERVAPIIIDAECIRIEINVKG